MKCSSSCRRRRASAKPSSGASISTSRACAASSKRCSLCPPHPTASPPPRWPARVRALSKQNPLQYGPRHAAYDLKKLRGKHIIRRIGHTRRYEPLLTGLRAMTALLVLRDQAIKPLLGAAQPLRPKRGAHNPKPIDLHYDAIQAAMKGVFHELGLAA